LTDIEKAIARMEKVKAACEKLIALAESDIKLLKKRKNNAEVLIEGFKTLSGTEHQQRIDQIALGLIETETTVSCMGIGIGIDI
jgi:hypothetical protein